VRLKKKSTIRYAVRMSGTEIATISHVRVFYTISMLNIFQKIRQSDELFRTV